MSAPGSTLRPGDIRVILIGSMLSMFLAAFDQTVVAPALPTIGKDLGDVAQIPWIVTSYLLVATAVTPLYGKFSDIYGRRLGLLIAVGIFVAGSLVSALAPSMLVLIAGRALQGLGAGGLIALPMTIVGDLIVPKERGRYQVYVAGVYATSSLLGPVLGGFFAEHVHWTWIFWINLPLGALALGISARALRRLPRHERRHSLDVLGAALMAGATVTFMLALSWGGTHYAWGSTRVVSLLVSSAGLWTLFAMRVLMAREPLVPIDIFTNRIVTTATVSACFGFGTFVGMTIYTPIFFESMIGLSASQSGLAMIPLMISTVIGATISGQMTAHVTHYKRMPVVGLSVAAIAALVLALFLDHLPFAVMELVLACISMGSGTLFPVTTVSIQNAVPPHRLGTATAAMGFFRQLGGALIVSIFGAIVLGEAATAELGTASEQLRAQLDDGAALAAAFRSVFLAAAGGFVLALATLLPMEEKPLRSDAGPAAGGAGSR